MSEPRDVEGLALVVGEKFSMDLIRGAFDASNAEDMGELILSTYVRNARATSEAHGAIAEILHSNDPDQMADDASLADKLITDAALNNLSITRGLLGERAITLTATEPDTVPIRYKNAGMVAEATGWPHPSNLAPLRYPGSIQIFDEPQTGNKPNLDEGDWWHALVLDNHFEPLVTITVHPLSVARRGIGRFLRRK